MNAAISCANDEMFEMSKYHADFDAVLRHKRLKRAVFLGYSHGGFFVTSYAIAHPERVAALVLIEPAIFNEREELLERARLAHEGRPEDSLKAMIRYVEPEIGRDENLSKNVAGYILKRMNNKRTLAGELMARANNPIDPAQLSRLEMPILLIGGGRSHVKSIVTTLARQIAEPYIWWVPDATHCDLTSRKFASEVTGTISRFLESTKARLDGCELPPSE